MFLLLHYILALKILMVTNVNNFDWDVPKLSIKIKVNE